MIPGCNSTQMEVELVGHLTPAGQLMHWIEPTRGVYVPSGQALQHA